MESTVSNYPGVLQTDTGDEGAKHAYAATLTAHAAGSVERNQDAQFSASRDLLMCRDIVAGTKDAEKTALVNRYEIAVQLKDSEIRHSERLSRIESLLAGQQAAQLSRELAEVKADARNGKLESLLAAIVAKLPTP